MNLVVFLSTIVISSAAFATSYPCDNAVIQDIKDTFCSNAQVFIQRADYWPNGSTGDGVWIYKVNYVCPDSPSEGKSLQLEYDSHCKSTGD